MKLLHHRAKISVRTYLNGDLLRTPMVSIRNIYEYKHRPAVLVMGNPKFITQLPDGTWQLDQHIQEVKALSGEELRQKLLASLQQLDAKENSNG